MNLQSLFSSIKKGVVSPAYLIYGEEAYLQKLIIKAFKKALINETTGEFNCDELDGDKVTPGQIVACAETLPVFAEKRLTIIKNAVFFQTGKKEGDNKKRFQESEKLLQYLHNPLTSTCLILLVKGSIDKRKKLVKAVEKAGQVVETAPLKGAELNNWLQTEVELLGKKIEPQAVEYMILNTNHDLYFLKNELEKLTLYSGDHHTITLEAMKKLVTKTSEANIFALVDEIGLKRGEAALLELKNLLERGEPPVRVVFMIARQFRLILTGKDLSERGYTEKQIAKELAIHPFVIRKILQQARRFTYQELEKCFQQILDCDMSLKRGVPPRVTLENLILGLTQGI